MRIILKGFLLFVSIVASYYVGKYLTILLRMDESFPANLQRFLKSDYAQFSIGLTILFLFFVFVLSMRFYYGFIGDGLKIIITLAILVINIYIMIINEDTRMIFDSENSYTTPYLLCTPMAFFIASIGENTISKLKIILIFISSVILFLGYSYVINDFQILTLISFLGMALVSIVFLYFYWFAVTMMIGNKIIKLSKS